MERGSDPTEESRKSEECNNRISSEQRKDDCIHTFEAAHYGEKIAEKRKKITRVSDPAA